MNFGRLRVSSGQIHAHFVGHIGVILIVSLNWSRILAAGTPEYLSKSDFVMAKCLQKAELRAGVGSLPFAL